MAGFLWGAGGQKLTQEQIDNQRKILAALAQRGDPAFNNAGWLGALGRGLEGAYEGWQDNKLKAEQNDLNTYNSSLLKDITGSLSGGTSMPSAASTGVGQELAATSPAPVVAEGEIADYIRQAATARGIDPNVALRVAMSEGGLKDPVRQSEVVKNGVREASYGPFQLYMGGGLGNKALEAGIDPRDPNQWRAGVDFALDQAVKGGWSPWYGAAKVGIGNRDGLGGARAIGYGQSSAPTAAPAAIEAVAPASGYVDPLVSAPNYQPSAEVVNALVPPLTAARNIAPAPVVASQPVQMAQATPPRMGFDPRILAVLNDPRANEQTRNMAKLLMDQQQGQQAAAQKQYLAEQQRQQEIARRQEVAQQAGINPAYAVDDELWKGAASQLFQDAPTATVNGIVVNTRTGQPIFNAPQQPTSGMQDYQSYADYETQAGRTPLGPLEYEQALRRSGAPTTEGAIPTGYQANRDAQGRVISLAPIPGGPEDKTKKEALQASQKENASDVITNAAVRAVQALNASGMPSTGLTGRLMSLNPSSNAAEVRRQASVLGANASTENINAMRAASPTGGALGAASDADLALLRAKSGALDPDSPTFERDVKDYTRTLLRLVHGNEAGDATFNAINWSASGDVPTDLPGVTIRRKGQ